MSKTLFTAMRNLKLVLAESALTAGLLCMSIMTPFYESLGFNHAEIAQTQIIFTLIMSVLNVPMGWVADRFSRKWANVIGDFGEAIVFMLYAQAQNFTQVVVCECLLGLCSALSQGVDQTLLRHFAQKVQPGENFFRRQTAKLNMWRYFCTLILVTLGGPIGAISFRVAITLSGVPYLVAGVVSLLIVDDSQKLAPTQSSLQDMRRIVTESWRKRPLRVRILAYAIGREMTHAVIWVFTPMLIYVGVPLQIVSLAWAFNSVACLLGSNLAKRFAPKLPDWQILAWPLALMALSMGILSWRLNLTTIGLYGLMGIVQGWTGATLMPLVQQYAAEAEQTTVISLAHVIGSVAVYTPAVGLVGRMADYNLRYAPLCTLLIFLPIGAYLTYRLRK